MDVAQVQRQYISFGNSMYIEGYLSDQFIKLQKLADENHSDLVSEVVTIFFDNFEKYLHKLSDSLEKPNIDFNEISELIHILVGSSNSFGAKKVKNLCVIFTNYCEEQNFEKCVKCFHQVKEEYKITKSKLETLLEMQEQIVAVGGVAPMVE